MPQSEVVRPPIPATCGHRPTVGGLVMPWANVALADGSVDFRTQHEARVQQCWMRCLCQLCGQRIDPPIVILGGPNQVAALLFDEPPMHPECAVYASQACPMVAGRQTHYATGPSISDGHRGATCPVPGCDCDGWVPHPGLETVPGGDPAHHWYALYVSSYGLAVLENRPGRVHAGVVAPDQILGVRHISAPGRGRIWARTTLSEAQERDD